MYSTKTQRDRGLIERDLIWLQKLADGELMKCLHTSGQYAKNEMRRIRETLKAETSIHAISIAFRRGLIK